MIIKIYHFIREKTINMGEEMKKVGIILVEYYSCKLTCTFLE
jgi:hypothetical protein